MTSLLGSMQGRGNLEEKKKAAIKEMMERLAGIEARLDKLEMKLGAAEERSREGTSDDKCTNCSDIIGCLEDCVDDPEELRKRARNVRSSDRGH